MKFVDLQKVATEQRNKNAVQFDQNIRYTKEKMWPFWYGFIPKLFLNESKFRNGLGPLGWKILPGETRDIHLKTQRDTAYLLLGLKYTPYICIDDTVDNPLTGTVSLNDGNLNVVGAGTLFTTELLKGQTIAVADGTGGFQFLSIRSITNNTNLILDEAPTVTAAGQIFSLTYKIWYNRILPKSKSDLSDLTNVAITQTNAPGTMSIGSGLVAMAGVGTAFVSAPNNLVIGDIIEYVLDGVPAAINGSTFLNQIATITNDTTATVAIANPAPGTSTKTYKRIANVKTGTITVTAATGAVVGAGTTFLADVVLGDTIFYLVAGIVESATVITITDNTNLTVNVNPNLVSAAGVIYAVQIGTTVNPSLPLPTLNFLFNPVSNLINVTLILTSLQNRYKYGATQYRPGSGLLERPEIVTALQGQDDGMGFIRTSALLPTESTLVIKATNISTTETIILNGDLFGYKVSLNELSKH